MTEERLKELEELARAGGAARWPDEIQALVAEVRRLRGLATQALLEPGERVVEEQNIDDVLDAAAAGHEVPG